MTVPRSWADLLKPEYKGEIQVANPASSGTAYTMVATLVQLMGEDKAFDYMKALHKNIGQYTRSGTGPIKAVARGETAVSISFVHDGPGEKMQGFPVETVTPSEGTGAEIGSMSIVKGARNLEAAKKFYEWALTPQAQLQYRFAPARARHAREPPSRRRPGRSPTSYAARNGRRPSGTRTSSAHHGHHDSTLGRVRRPGVAGQPNEVRSLIGWPNAMQTEKIKTTGIDALHARAAAARGAGVTIAERAIAEDRRLDSCTADPHLPAAQRPGAGLRGAALPDCATGRRAGRPLRYKTGACTRARSAGASPTDLVAKNNAERCPSRMESHLLSRRIQDEIRGQPTRASSGIAYTIRWPALVQIDGRRQGVCLHGQLHLLRQRLSALRSCADQARPRVRVDHPSSRA